MVDLILRGRKWTESREQRLGMVPFTLLQACIGSIVLVELKNGEMYKGILEACDIRMNFMLKDITCTSQDGKETQISQSYIKGVSVKYLSVDEEKLEQAEHQEREKMQKRDKRPNNQRGKHQNRNKKPRNQSHKGRSK